MQVSNENNWTNRSLSYLYRTFDSMEKGEDYNNVNPVINTLKLCNSDFRAKEVARKYEDRVRHQKYLEKQLAEKDNMIAYKDNEIAKMGSEIAKLRQEIENLKSQK